MAIISEVREVSGFDRVSLKGYGDILLEQGDEESLQIEAEQELLPKISSEVRNGELVIEFKQDWLNWMFNPPRGVTYRVKVRQLSSVSIAGAGSLDANTIKGERLELSVTGSGNIGIRSLDAFSLTVAISGSGKMEAAGRVENEQIRINGAGSVDVQAVKAENVSVRIAGSGKAKVDAKGKLEVGIAGYGEVEYMGSPKISQRITGAGKIESIGGS